MWSCIERTGKFHMAQTDTLDILSDGYGITIEPYTESADLKDESYIKINRDELANLGGAFENIPFLINHVQNKNYYSEAYRVIYDKGLGELQKSAKTPGLFRANVVAQGTNNNVVGQAELASLNPSEALRASQVALSAYSIAAVITNQYYLANINERLSNIEKTTSTIKRYLETQKKMEQLSDSEYLVQKISNIKYIEDEPVYRQTVLATVQQIKLREATNMKFYKEELVSLFTELSVKDKRKITEEFVSNYQGVFPEYWFSTFLYVMAAYVETRLSGIKDEDFLVDMQIDMLETIKAYQDAAETFDNRIRSYFKNVKNLNSNPNVEMAIRVIGGVGGFAALGVGGIKAGDKFARGIYSIKADEKSDEKNRLKQSLDEFHNVYTNIEALIEPVKAIDLMNSIANYPVELIVSENDAYVKITQTKPVTLEQVQRKA